VLLIFIVIMIGSGVFFEGVSVYPLRVLFQYLNRRDSPIFLIITIIGGFYLLLMLFRASRNKPPA